MAERVTVGAAELAELIASALRAAHSMRMAEAEIKRLRAENESLKAEAKRDALELQDALDQFYGGTGTLKWDLEP